jgi:hypothetical protein
LRDSEESARARTETSTYRSVGNAIRKRLRRTVKSAFNLLGLDIVRREVLTGLFAEHQFKAERTLDYQTAMAQDHPRTRRSPAP